MDPISIVSLLANVAPSVIKFVKGDDAADKAGALIDVAKKVAGIEDPKDAVAAIAADPQLLMQFEQRMVEIQLEEVKAQLADIDSARQMQVAALQQDDPFAKRFIYYFAAAWSIFSMFYFCWATFGTITNQRFADTILGFLLGTAIAGIFQFFFGSTARSAKKDETILGLTKATK